MYPDGSIEIVKAENGYIVNVRRGEYEDRKVYVFVELKHALAFIVGEFEGKNGTA